MAPRPHVSHRHDAPPWPIRLREAFAVLPDVRRARRALERERDVRTLLARLDETPVRDDGVVAAPQPVYRGVCAAIRLIRYRDAGPCLYAALALYVALRRRGHAPTFVSGVRREPEGIVGHAWIELGDQVLDPIGGVARGEYAETVRHPAPRADSVPARQLAQR